jgi:enoyl-CoA hydratase/carnithine racemase
MPEPLLLLDRDDDVVTLTFNDPDRRNAMTRAMGEAFAGEIAALAGDTRLRAVILTGAGRAFSAGGDLEMIEARAREGATDPLGSHLQIRDTMRDFYGLFLRVRELPCPTLAALGGAAIGAGLCVALVCDVRIAASDAKLGLNFTALGLHPGMGATWTLPRLVGPARAAELLYSSRIITGSEAAEMGLVNRAVAADSVMPTTLELARSFAANGPMAVRGVKRSLAQSSRSSLEAQLDREADDQARCFAGADIHEGLAAVREKRLPRFTGK